MNEMFITLNDLKGVYFEIKALWLYFIVDITATYQIQLQQVTSNNS